MDVFGKRGVSFVSVTQQFNSTHSMGRLTLNILLSFAQFEREIIAERTKDKMSAARRKGKWVGGIPVLGYDILPDGGKLIVNADEAAQVRAIFQLYLEHEGLVDLAQELNCRGWRSKRWTSARGKVHGGRPYSKSILLRMLRNFVYIGKVDYEGAVYQGEHEAIIDESLWNKVQCLLSRNGRTGAKEVRNRYGALLRGILYCTPCQSVMTHSVTTKNNRHYRYYVCQGAQQKGWASCPSKSLNAHEIEQAVIAHIRGISSNRELLQATLGACRERVSAQIEELYAEQQVLRKVISNCQELLCSQNVLQNPDQLVDIHEQIQKSELRLSVILREKTAFERGMLTEEEMTSAMTSFTPVWDNLTPHEQGTIIALLVERVGYDGRDGSVNVQFRSSGLKQLCGGK